MRVAAKTLRIVSSEGALNRRERDYNGLLDRILADCAQGVAGIPYRGKGTLLFLN